MDADTDSIGPALWNLLASLALDDLSPLSKHLKPTLKGALPSRVIWQFIRIGGLGDVAMACAAAQGIKALKPADQVWLLTSKAYSTLPAACPFVDRVFVSQEALEAALNAEPGPHRAIHRHELSPAAFSLVPEPQVRTHLRELELFPPSRALSLTLDVPAETVSRVIGLVGEGRGQRRVLLHPVQGDSNLTWPGPFWEDLARRLLKQGHQVILVGDRRVAPHKGLHSLDVQGALDLTDQMELLDFVALCRISDLVVTTDSGPIQLAGASDIGILGIFSVLPGMHRLPIRHGVPGWNAVSVEPSCALKGCHRFLGQPRHVQRNREAFLRGKDGLSGLLAKWCLADEPYACLNSQISPDLILDAIGPLLDRSAGERAERVLKLDGAMAGGNLEAIQSLLPPDQEGLDPCFGVARVHACMAQRKPDVAIPVLLRLLDRDPTWIEALEALLVCFLLEGRNAEATRTLRGLTLVDSSNPLVPGAWTYLKAWTEMNDGLPED